MDLENKIYTIDGVEVPVGNHLGKKVLICADHRGFLLKRFIIDYLLAHHKVNAVDLGAFNEERCDYIDFAAKVARGIGGDYNYRTIGIGICGSGIGMSYATKFPGVYATRCLNEEEAANSRMHNNSNFLALAADKTDEKDAAKILDAWLTAKFTLEAGDGAYLRRFIKLVKLEQQVYEPENAKVMQLI